MSEMTVGMVCEWLTRIGITDARVEAAFRLQHIDGEWDNTFGCLSPLIPALLLCTGACTINRPLITMND